MSPEKPAAFNFWRPDPLLVPASVSYAYDAQGRLQKATDARNGDTTYTYYDDNQVKTVTTPDPDAARSGVGYDAQVTQYAYDSNGHLSTTTLPDMTTTSREYYATGLLKKSSGSLTYPQLYTYDAQGRVKTLTTWQNYAGDAGKAVTTWNYDPVRGWLTSKKYNDNKGPSYQYYASGRLKTRTWARGIVSTYSYDTAGDLSGIVYSDTTPAVSMTYDRMGRVLTTTDVAGTLTRMYHASGALQNETYGTTGLLANLGFTRGFDTMDRPSSLTPSGFTGLPLTYGYDAASRLQTITTGTTVGTYAYVPNSSLTQSLTVKTGGTTRLTATKVYDKLNRLSSITNAAGTTQSVGYDYNGANERSKATQEDGSYWDYGYDSLGQVTSAKKKLATGTVTLGSDYSYQYDDIGNRKTATANGQTSTFTATLLNQYSQRTIPGSVDVTGSAATDATVTVNLLPTQRQGTSFYAQVPVANTTSATNASIAITAVKNNAGPSGEDVVATTTKNAFVAKTPESFVYDDDGNLTSDARWNYTWDAENRLIVVESQSSAVTAGLTKQKLEFSYDAQGRRVQKKVSTWNTSTSAYTLTSDTRFIYDGWNLLAELNALSSNATVRSYAWGLDMSGSMQGAGGVGGLLIVNGNSLSFSPGYDGNGNLNSLVNLADGTVAAHFEYDVFGNVTKASGVATNACPFGFSSKYQDAETAQTYYGFRYYNPSTGRWLSRDPIEEAGGANIYGFVGNDGINRIDRLGLVTTVPGPLVTPEEIVEALRALRPGAPRSGYANPAPGPIGGYYNYNTQPNWSNSDVATMARTSGSQACAACKKLAMSAAGQNQYFYSQTSIGRATGAAAVLWKTQTGQRASIDPPGLRAAKAAGNAVDRGHLIPREYGGSGGYENIVTQEMSFNRGEFRTAVNGKIDAALSGGDNNGCKFVCVLVVPVYAGVGRTGAVDPGRPVPKAFAVTVSRLTPWMAHRSCSLR